MAFLDDLAVARTRVATLKSELSAAEAALADLEAQLMRGGPDVSEHNGDVDWVKVKTVADIAFVRVSDGDLQDALYSAARVSAVRSAGLSFAPYYYARVASDGNGQRSPRSEAAMAYYFASKQGWGKAGDLPLVYDVEQNAGESTTFQGQTLTKAATHVAGWIAAYQGLTGHLPIIYINPSASKALVGVMTAEQKALLAKCPLWIAHWGTTTPTIPAPWTSAVFHQDTDSRVFPGIANPADGNRVLVTRAEVDALRIR